MTPCPAGRTALSVVGTTAALGAATLAYSLIEARCPVLRRIDVPVLAADVQVINVPGAGGTIGLAQFVNGAGRGTGRRREVASAALAQ